MKVSTLVSNAFVVGVFVAAALFVVSVVGQLMSDLAEVLSQNPWIILVILVLVILFLLRGLKINR